MPLSNLPHNHGQDLSEILALLPNTDDFQIVAELFKLLSDCSRLRIFWLLCHCEECVINLSAIMDMSSPAVSHHLKQLKATGLITSRRDGKEVYYRAADTETVSVLHNMLEILVSISCPNKDEYHKNDDADPDGRHAVCRLCIRGILPADGACPEAHLNEHAH